MLEKRRQNWSKVEKLNRMATMIKTALKVLHTKSPENQYQALVNTKAEGEDEVKKLTEDDLRKVTKIRGESWSAL